MIVRDSLPDGSLRLSAGRCRYTFTRLRPGVLLIAAEGQETGDLGRAPIGEVAVETSLHPPARLFIDLAGLTQVATVVSDDWTAWFRANTRSLRRVDVLVDSVFVRLTVAVSQLFSGTGDLIRIHQDPVSFTAAIREEAPSFRWRADEE